MASLIYDSLMSDLAAGNIVPGSDTYFVMLVTSSYTPNQGTHAKRSDVTNEVSGTGYTSPGTATTCTPSINTSTHIESLTFSSVSWTTATITAAAAVIYKSRGGSSSADNLVAYVDFGGSVSSTAATFQVTFSSALTMTN